MGLIKDAIGSALGANDVRNGFSGPRLFSSNNQAGRSPSRDPPPYPPGPQVRDEVSSRYENSKRVSDYSHSLDTQSCYQDPSHLDEATTLRRGAYSYTARNGEEYLRQRSPSPSHDFSRFMPQENWYQPSRQSRGIRPLVLPQITIGDGEPFLRGYSNELEPYGIMGQEFIEIVDAINVAIIPNPEVQIFQKAANITGWFIPGAASLGLMAGQFGVGIANGVGHASLINRVLSKANLEVFLPRALELCIGKTQHVDAEVGGSARPQQYESTSSMQSSPGDRIARYGDRVARLSVVLPPLQNVGRSDPLALVGKKLGQQNNQRNLRRAQKKMDKGRSRGNENSSDGGISWIMVRQASPAVQARYRARNSHEQQVEYGAP